MRLRSRGAGCCELLIGAQDTKEPCIFYQSFTPTPINPSAHFLTRGVVVSTRSLLMDGDTVALNANLKGDNDRLEKENQELKREINRLREENSNLRTLLVRTKLFECSTGTYRPYASLVTIPTFGTTSPHLPAGGGSKFPLRTGHSIEFGLEPRLGNKDHSYQRLQGLVPCGYRSTV